MTLNELFVSHKQVDPVKFESTTVDPMQDIYLNLARAQQAVSSDESEESSDVWTVQDSEDIDEDTEDTYNWRVDFGKTSPVDPEQHALYQKQSNSNNTMSKGKQWLKQAGAWWDELVSGAYDKFNVGDKLQKAKTWLNKFISLGMSNIQALALTGQVYAECGFNPKKPMTYELSGKSNNKSTHGWSGAGEGAVQFTHWDTKQKLIKKYNADSRREGPKLTTDRDTYNKATTRHISDVSENDHALLTYLFYEDLINNTASDDFYNLFGAFYLRKAGNFASDRSAPLIEQAYSTGKYYQKSHTNNGLTNAGKVNNMLKALYFTQDLGTTLGYIS